MAEEKQYMIPLWLLLLNQIYCSLLGPAGRRSIQFCLCFTTIGARVWQPPFQGVKFRDHGWHGYEYSLLSTINRKLQGKVLTLCDTLGKSGYIIRNADSFTGYVFG